MQVQISTKYKKIHHKLSVIQNTTTTTKTRTAKTRTAKREQQKREQAIKTECL